jgi:hypothetical protein
MNGYICITTVSSKSTFTFFKFVCAALITFEHGAALLRSSCLITLNKMTKVSQPDSVICSWGPLLWHLSSSSVIIPVSQREEKTTEEKQRRNYNLSSIPKNTECSRRESRNGGLLKCTKSEKVVLRVCTANYFRFFALIISAFNRAYDKAYTYVIKL